MFAILLVLATSGDGLSPQSCDRVELNQIYECCDGVWRPRLQQWIFWSWSDRHQCEVVHEWQIASSRQRPFRVGGRLLVPIYSATHGARIIAHRVYQQSWTDHDPEVDNRNVVPPAQRKPLTPTPGPRPSS